MSLPATKAMIGPVNISLDLHPEAVVFAEFDNGGFNQMNLGETIGDLKQIHIITPLLILGTVELPPASDKPNGTIVGYRCYATPILYPDFSASQCMKFVTKEFRSHVYSLVQSIAPQICSREKTKEAWQVSLQTTFEDRHYKLFIQFS